MDQATKNVLMEIFSILGFSEEEKKSALLDFEKRTAAELLATVQNELPENYRDFIKNNEAKLSNPQDPTVIEIRNALRTLHSKDEYQVMGKKIIRDLLPKYVAYMSEGLDAEKIELLNAQLTKL